MYVHNTIKTFHTAGYVKNNKHLMMAICQLHSMHLQKEMKSKDRHQIHLNGQY